MHNILSICNPGPHKTCKTPSDYAALAAHPPMAHPALAHPAVAHPAVAYWDLCAVL